MQKLFTSIGKSCRVALQAILAYTFWAWPRHPYCWKAYASTQWTTGVIIGSPRIVYRCSVLVRVFYSLWGYEAFMLNLPIASSGNVVVQHYNSNLVVGSSCSVPFDLSFFVSPTTLLVRRYGNCFLLAYLYSGAHFLGWKKVCGAERAFIA